MSCLFDSLAHYIDNVSSQELRFMITEYLEKDPVFFDELDNYGRLSSLLQYEDARFSLPAYVKNMKEESTWGGAIEIRAFCELFQVRVIVRVYSNKKSIEFVPQSQNPHHTVEIGYTGNHYVPISIT